MNRPVIICKPDTSILKATGNIPVVLTIPSLSALTEAFNLAGKHRVHTLCVEVKGNLSDVPFREEWKEMPIALFIERLGSFTELAPKLDFLRTSGTTVYFPSAIDESYVSLQILSSLGISCGLEIDKSINWEAFKNLYHYALYPKVQHASIEPFEYLCANYEPEAVISLVLFKDETLYYVVIDENSIPDEPTLHSRISEKKQARSSQLRRFMQKNQQCAKCKAWRICAGEMQQIDPIGKECSEAMSELLDIVHNRYCLKSQKTCPQ